MENEKKIKTEAEMQIERLIQLKIEKEKKEREKMLTKTIRPIKTFNSPFYKKGVGYIKIEKKTYDLIHKIVTTHNKFKKNKTSKTKFVNNILKAFFELNLDYSVAADIEKLKIIFKNLESK